MSGVRMEGPILRAAEQAAHILVAPFLTVAQLLSDYSLALSDFSRPRAEPPATPQVQFSFFSTLQPYSPSSQPPLHLFTFSLVPKIHPQAPSHGPHPPCPALPLSAFTSDVSLPSGPDNSYRMVKAANKVLVAGLTDVISVSVKQSCEPRLGHF